MADETPKAALLAREVRSIYRYLPSVYMDQMIVDFVCGCWQGSRDQEFRYDCPAHRAKQETPSSVEEQA